MKVLLVNNYWYIRGGAERVVFATKKLLENTGNEVEIFGMNHPENIIKNKYFIDFNDYENVKGLKKIKAGIRFIYNRQAKKNFEELVEDFKPDIIHFHNIAHQLSFSILEVLKNKKIKSVMTLHDYKLINPNYNLFHHGKIDENMLGGKYYNCLLNNCMENFSKSLIYTLEAYYRYFKKYVDVIDEFISPSQFLKNKFVEAGFSRDKIKVIPNPVDIDKPFLDIKDEKYVAYAGRISHEKGVDLILEFAKFTKNIKYKLAGSGPLEKKLKEKIEQQKINNVELVGYKTDEELLDFLRKSSFIILPSQWLENCPLSILEAKAIGKIILASNLGGIKEMLPIDLLCPPADIKFWVDKINLWNKKTEEERNAEGKKLRKECQDNNSLTVYFNSLMKLYKEIAEKNL